MRFHTLILSLALLLPLSGLAATWSSTAKIDLNKVRGSTQLAEIISSLTMEIIEDGESEDENEEGFSCRYFSTITHSSVKQNTYTLLLEFHAEGSNECGENEEGVKWVWEDLRSLQHVKLSRLVRIEAR